MSSENNSLYYYSENNEVLGPYTVHELRGKINTDSLVVGENGTKWVKASDVPEIADILFAESSDDLALISPDNFAANEGAPDDIQGIQPETQAISQTEGGEGKMGKSRLFKRGITVLIILGLIAVGIYTFLHSDFYKWKDAVKMYCYIPSLKIRTDTATFNDYNVLPNGLEYGESVLVLDNLQQSQWVNVKIGRREGFVNGNFLMSEKDFMILTSLLDTESKRRQIKISKYRKSLVSHITNQSRMNSLPEQTWSIVSIENNLFIKTRKSYYSDNDYAIFILKNGIYEELAVFIYNDNYEISKQSYTDLSNLEVEEVNNYLGQFNLRY